MTDYVDDSYNEEDFPYPVKLTRESFLQKIEKYEQGDKILLDKFMYDSYRFISLDDLSSDLRSLLKELDDELVNLINNDYDEFIKLGRSIDGSIELINNIKFDLNGYYNELQKNKDSLNDTDTYLNQVISYRKSLQNLKKICSNLILINNQIDSFNRLLQDNSINIKRLIGLFLSVHKNLKVSCIFIRQNNLDEANVEFIQNLINKSNILKLEFKTYLEQIIENDNVDEFDKLSACTFRKYLF